MNYLQVPSNNQENPNQKSREIYTDRSMYIRFSASKSSSPNQSHSNRKGHVEVKRKVHHDCEDKIKKIELEKQTLSHKLAIIEDEMKKMASHHNVKGEKQSQRLIDLEKQL